jgi:hypothetical protein
MAYIGRQLARGENKLFDDISSSFNGSTTVFNLTVSSVATSTATPFQLFVSLGGVMQKPNTDFTTAGNQITFTTAPAAGLSCWIMMQGDTIDQAAIPDASVTPSKISGSNFAFSGDLRLKDADGSHYVGFASPSTVSTNKVWTLPAADGTSGQFLKTNGSAVLSWDTVDTSTLMPLSGGIFSGDVTFDGATAGYDIVWDKSDNALEWADNAKAKFGTGGDLEIFHNASNSVINDAGTGDLLLQVGGSTKATVSSTGFGVTGALTVSTNATITGNLTVSGTTTTVDSVTLSVKDKNIEMGVVSSPSDTTADGGGITLKGASDKTFNWVNATDAWTSSEHIHLIDNKKLFVGGASGTTDGLEIVHNGSNSILNDSGTGTLQLQLGGSTKLEVQSGGINVTGAISVNGAALASGNTFTAVANGSIANNKAVKLDSDGKVSEIAETVSAVTSINNGTGTGSGSWAGLTVGTVNAAAFSVTSGLGYYFSQDTQNSPYQVKATAVRFDGNDGTFGIKAGASRQTITAITTDHCWKPHAAWDAANNKIMVVYQRDSDGELYGTWLTPNQSSSPYFTASGTELHPFTYDFDDVPKIVYGGSGRFLTAFCTKASSWNIKTRAIYYNSGSYSLGDYTDLTPDGTSSAKPRNPDLAYHTANDKVIAVWKDGSNSNYGKIRVGSWTGSGGSLNISWGTESTFHAGAIQHPQVIVDDNTGKIVVCYYKGSTNTWQSIVGVLSGTSVTFGSAVQVSSVGGMNSDNDWGFDLIYVSGVQKVKFYWNGNTGGYKGQTATGTVSSSSSTITWSNVGTIMSNGLNQGVAVFAATPDTTYNRVFYYGQDVSYANTGRFKTEILSTPVTNLTDANDCIGFADQAYTNGQTATIKTYGNNIDTLSGLTIGSLYYVQGDGTLDTSWDSSGLSSFASNTPLAGIALSASKLLIRDPLART